MTEEVKAAIDCLRYHPTKESAHIEHGRQNEFRRYASDIIDNETSYDAHEDRLTKQELVIATEDLLINIKEEMSENPGKTLYLHLRD